MGHSRRIVTIAFTAAISFGAVVAATAQAQPVPRPFPRPGEPAPPPPRPQPERPPEPESPVVAPGSSEPADIPGEETLGLPVYPGADFIASYDAGRGGQRYYLFGTNVDFAGIVTYYRNLLRQRGNLVFDAPATHIFEVGRFRDEAMAFPPSVTVKDYTWGGSEGYLSVRPDTPPTRYHTIIQIVPAPQTP